MYICRIASSNFEGLLVQIYKIILVPLIYSLRTILRHTSACSRQEMLPMISKSPVAHQGSITASAVLLSEKDSIYLLGGARLVQEAVRCDHFLSFLA